jgi:hypothetical protein
LRLILITGVITGDMEELILLVIIVDGLLLIELRLLGI